MNRQYRLGAFYLALCIVLATLVLGCGFSPGGHAPAADKATVTVELTEGVGGEAAAEIKQAADATAGFFAETYGLRLEKPVTIVLTRDRKAYVAEIVKRFNIDELAAQRASQGTDAVSGGRFIIVNDGGIPTTRLKTFLIAHELTHQYQHQIAGASAGKVKWLLEGMAETVGAQVVARRGYWSVAQYRNNWQVGLQAADNKPDLGDLETAAGWSAAIAGYGSSVTYKTAGLAVLTLTERFSQGKVLDYFAGLGRGETPGNSFHKAFGISMADFAAEYRRIIVRKAS